MRRAINKKSCGPGTSHKRVGGSAFAELEPTPAGDAGKVAMAQVIVFVTEAKAKRIPTLLVHEIPHGDQKEAGLRRWRS